MKKGSLPVLMSLLALALAACGGPPSPVVPPGGHVGPLVGPPGGPGPGGPEPSMANPASKNCIDKGGKLEIRTDPQGNESGMCMFKDGSSCDEWAFMNGQCAPGQKR